MTPWEPEAVSSSPGSPWSGCSRSARSSSGARTSTPGSGLEAWQKPGVQAFLPSSLALLVVLAVPRLSDRLAAALARSARRVPRRLREPLLLVFASATTLLLTNYQLSGDGPNIMLEAQFGLGAIYPSHALTAYIHSALVDVVGLDGREAVRLVSCASGVVYTAAALRIARVCFEDPGRRAGTTALLLLTGTAALFFGNLEVYPTLAAGIAVYLLVSLRHLEAPRRFPWPALVLGITFGLHGLAGVVLPSLLFLANDGAVRPPPGGALAALGGGLPRPGPPSVRGALPPDLGRIPAGGGTESVRGRSSGRWGNPRS
jgi:hypothetical protein